MWVIIQVCPVVCTTESIRSVWILEAFRHGGLSHLRWYRIFRDLSNQIFSFARAIYHGLIIWYSPFYRRMIAKQEEQK